MLVTRHVLAKGLDCAFIASFLVWFCQKLVKKAKSNSKIVKIWWFLWNPHLVDTKIGHFLFLAFLINFWPNHHYFTVTFGFFDQFLGNPHLVACQNRTISTFGRCMSASNSQISLPALTALEYRLLASGDLKNLVPTNIG